jgi:hypothetical protein
MRLGQVGFLCDEEDPGSIPGLVRRIQDGVGLQDKELQGKRGYEQEIPDLVLPGVGGPGSTESARKDIRMRALHSRYLQRPAAADERVPGRRYAEAGGKLGNGRSQLKISQRVREVRLEYEYNNALGLVESGDDGQSVAARLGRRRCFYKGRRCVRELLVLRRGLLEIVRRGVSEESL